jgi:hypothetical protein
MSNLPTTVGNMRWSVLLADEYLVQKGVTLKTVYENPVTVFAAIGPSKPYRALYGVQADIGNFTHRIVIRYRHDIHLFKAVIRQRERIDGTINIEIFRIHSVTEWEGQQIWLVLDAELLTGTN